jgi:8-oxo-dGTP diphosphatase
MVQERGLGPDGRHDGDEYWTLPGGGVEPDEDVAEALVREVREEVGLTCTSWNRVCDYPYPSGLTTVFDVIVEPGDPRLGEDELGCECPRMIGLAWIQTPPEIRSVTGGQPIPLVLLAVTDARITSQAPSKGAEPAIGGRCDQSSATR